MVSLIEVRDDNRSSSEDWSEGEEADSWARRTASNAPINPNVDINDVMLFEAMAPLFFLAHDAML